MTTPKTGRPRGRPRKHPDKIKRPRGRPPASLREDPERYEIAYLAARIMLCRTTKPTTLARDIAQINACEISSHEDAVSLVAALDAKFTDLLPALVLDCPKRGSVGVYDRCRAVFERRG
jgi:hypothetical protein